MAHGMGCRAITMGLVKTGVPGVGAAVVARHCGRSLLNSVQVSGVLYLGMDTLRQLTGFGLQHCTQHGSGFGRSHSMWINYAHVCCLCGHWRFSS